MITSNGQQSVRRDQKKKKSIIYPLNAGDGHLSKLFTSGVRIFKYVPLSPENDASSPPVCLMSSNNLSVRLQAAAFGEL